MNYDLVIDSSSQEVSIAFLDDKLLTEIHKEKSNNNYSVGDVYLGRVKKIMPGLNAAFVDVGYEKDAFLHYLDLGPQVNSLFTYMKLIQSGKINHSTLKHFRFEKDIDKSGKINDVLSSNQNIIVQIAKEPISTKGPRVSSEISLPGRFIVLVPFSDRISVSQKIKSSEERDRLKKIVSEIKPKNFGVIIRTVANGKNVTEIEADIKDLVSKWDEMFHQLKASPAPPLKILGELSRTSAILRDVLNPNFNSIQVADPALYEEIKTYIRTIAPDKESIVKLYKGKVPIFEHFGIDKQIKGSFGKTVSFKSGAYLVIEHTEALHVIDVNSGHRAKSENNQETNALEVNLEAAKEIARQLRLRDMGGIIVIDFIDMHSMANRKLLYEKMKEEMKNDRAKHNILPPSKFGLVQITRQRVRPETNIKTVEKCPSCKGTGEVEASILFVEELENNLRYILKEQNEKSVTLSVHPFIAAYLTKGLISIEMKWWLKYGKKVKVKAEPSYHFMEFHFFNKNEDEINL